MLVVGTLLSSMNDNNVQLRGNFCYGSNHYQPGCVVSAIMMMVGQLGIGYLQIAQCEPLYQYEIYIGTRKLLTYERI